MEHAQKNTLKTLMAEGLHGQPDMIWRLFR
jgi:hypothetical protein